MLPFVILAVTTISLHLILSPRHLIKESVGYRFMKKLLGIHRSGFDGYELWQRKNC